MKKNEDQTINEYLSKFPSKILTIEQEQEIFYRIKRGDSLAKKELINHNQKLVIHIVKRYVSLGLDFWDLVQAGNLGLGKAVDKFDIDLGNKFSTYATNWVKQEIERTIEKHSNEIRLPSYVISTLRQIRIAENKLFLELHRKPTNKEIAIEINWDKPIAQLDLLIMQTQKPLSIDNTIKDDDDDKTTLENFVVADTTRTPMDEAELASIRDMFNDLATRLDKNEKYVLRRRIVDDETLEAVGDELNLSKERIRQIQESGLEKLRKAYLVKYGKEDPETAKLVQELLNKKSKNKQ